MIITLKDGSKKEYAEAKAVIDIAYDISEGLARAACAGEVNGEVVDLRTVLDSDCELNILTAKDEKGLAVLRHTASHVMAQAVQNLYPNAKVAIGPSIDTGFYYDFECQSFTRDDLDAIEKEMKKIIKKGAKIERFTKSREEAIAFFKEKNEPYKVELIEDLPEDAEISFYSQGDWVDLCAGPHLMSVKPIKAFKLTASSGAYWRGNENNKMLTRIYGTAYTKKADLEERLKYLEEIKLRDHNRLGRDMELFTTVDVIGQGLPLIMPNGVIIMQELQRWIEDEESRRGYVRTKTPLMAKNDLYKISGHWDHYKDDMFPAMEMDNEAYVLRPMNCPHHMVMYKNFLHSYKDLPVRIAEIANDFRYEAAGAVKGIERGRHFCQNDAHLFVTPEQIKSEFKNVVDLIFDVYKDFNITNYRCVLSLRDPEDKEKYHQDDEMWNKAENELREVLNELGIEYTEEIGEAAFYGPKLDVNVKPAIGNEITLSTCQLDFCLPAKFDLKYVDKDGVKKTPVVLHRAILGSLDRFMAYILEETKGALPTWLSPVQVKIIPVNPEIHKKYSEKVLNELKELNIRAELDDRNEKLGYRMRESQTKKIPYSLIIGDKESSDNLVSYRKYGSTDTTTVSKDEFKDYILNIIKDKK